MARLKVKPKIEYMPALAIRPGYTVVYSIRADGKPMNRRCEMPKINQPEGVLSGRAEKRIRHAVQWLMIGSDLKTVYSRKEGKSFTFLLNFITLTLSEKQKHSDQEIKQRLLNPFIDWLHRCHGVNAYLWKAEAQKATGNIHFHITTNVFVHWRSVRRKWNELQYSLGYHRAFTEGNRDGKNSTDVKAVRNTKKIGYYLSKYFTKNETDRRKIHGKLWGSSYNLSNIKINLCPHDEDFQSIADEFFSRNEHIYKKLDYSELYIHDRIDTLKLHPLLKKRIEGIRKQIQGGTTTVKRYEVASFF